MNKELKYRRIKYTCQGKHITISTDMPDKDIECSICGLILSKCKGYKLVNDKKN